MKLGLGTAQFGMDYGVTNEKGRVAETEVEKILALAAEHHVRILDTAAGYGESEAVLGRVLGNEHTFDLVTKAVLPRGVVGAKQMADSFKNSLCRSLDRLGQPQLYGFLAHHVQDLLQAGGEEVVAAMQQMKAEGLVRKIGVSVYYPEEIDAVLDLFIPDLVQLPMNVFDQRFLRTGCLKKLKALDVEIHARSLFLQGVLLSGAEDLPAYFAPIHGHVARYFRWLSAVAVTPLQAALCFAERQACLDAMIVGVCSVSQLAEILQAARTIPDLDSRLDFAQWAINDERYIIPANWSVQ